jgi:hypothetical protein
MSKGIKMENNTVSLKVDESAIEPIVEKALQTAIVKNLGNSDEIIESMVSIALSEKVGRDGYPAKYSSDNKYDFLEAVTNKAIRTAAKEILEEWLGEQREQLKKAMLIELNKPSRQRKIVKCFVDAAEKAFKCSWNFDCKFVFEKESDY